MKNPFPTNPSPGDIFLAGPVRISQIHGERSPRIWTPEQCRYAAHAINQHDKLVAVVRCLLLSADAAWEADAGGHDWPEACQLARAVLKEEKT